MLPKFLIAHKTDGASCTAEVQMQLPVIVAAAADAAVVRIVLEMSFVVVGVRELGVAAVAVVDRCA